MLFSVLLMLLMSISSCVINANNVELYAQEKKLIEPVIVRVETHENELFLGQKIECIVSLLFTKGYGDHFLLDDFVESGFELIETLDLPSDELVIQGILYKRIRKKIILQAKKVGSFTTEPVYVNWSVPQDNNSIKGFGFAVFVVNKLFSSNQLRFNVKQAPDDSQLIARSVELTCNLTSSTCALGQAITYELLVTSDGLLYDLDIDVLTLNADLFDSYFSNATIDDSCKDKKQYIKKFEFVIQPKKVGEYELPPQTITFFNPDTHQLETCSSPSLFLHVNAPKGGITQTINPAVIQEELKSPPISLSVQDYAMNWNIYFSLVIIILLLYIALLFKNFLQSNLWIKKKLILYKASIALQAAKKENSYKKLYAILESVIADPELFDLLSEPDKKKLKQCSQLVSETAFSPEDFNDKTDLFLQVRQWIVYLSKQVHFF